MQNEKELGSNMTPPANTTPPTPVPPAQAQAVVTPNAGQAEKTVRIRLSSKRKAEALNPGITNMGMSHVVMPDFETQLKGFDVPKEIGGMVVDQFSQYKFDVKKGEDVPSVSKV